jgi:hypothetical protein
MKVYKFDPVIYPYKLWIIIDKTPNDIANKFNEYDNTPMYYVDTDTKRHEAFTMPVVSKENPEYGVVIFFRSKNMSYELVSHEASHAAKYMFSHIGASVVDHEPFEYVVGWIAGCCEKVKSNKVNEWKDQD